MPTRVAVTLSVLFLSACVSPRDPHQLEYGDLPNPPINMFRVVQGNSEPESPVGRTRGIIEFHLSAAKPSTTFWNDPDKKKDPWGTVTLKQVEKDGTVVITLGNEETRTKPGGVFPGTGLVLIEANTVEQSALLRSKFTMTVARENPQ